MLLQKSKCLVGAAMWLLAWSGAAVAQNVVVKTFPAGSGENDAGIVDASEDTEIDGPQALTTDENGALYLLDQVNGRIVRFDPKRPADESTILRLPGDLRPSDLIVRNSDILVWDGSVRSLRPAPRSDGTSTRGLEEVSTRAADDPSVLSAFAQMGSQQPGSAADLLDANTRAGVVGQPRTRARQHVASRGAGPVLVDVIPDDRGRGARLEVAARDQRQRSPDVAASPRGAGPAGRRRVPRDRPWRAHVRVRREHAVRRPAVPAPSLRAIRRPARSKASTSCP